MKQLFLIAIGLLSLPAICISQSFSGKLKLDQGQVVGISMQVTTKISQQAGDQSIDFNVNASADQTYKVTNATEDNNTLHHQLKRIAFNFEGMGTKRSFDSNEEKDMKGSFGKPMKEMLEKSYDMIIDNNGKTLMAFPEKITIAAMDNQMAIIGSLMKDVIDLVQPPQKGKGSFFSVLPDTAIQKGDTWNDATTTATGKFNNAYTLSDFTDSTLIVDFEGSSVTVTTAEMMGSETKTTMNNKSTGKIILDRLTGIIREKTINTESNGNTESPFGNLPVTSKTTTTILVNPVSSQ